MPKINKIFVCGNTATKLGTGGGRGLLSTARKSQFQTNRHISVTRICPFALWPYNRHLCPKKTFSRILPDFQG